MDRDLQIRVEPARDADIESACAMDASARGRTDGRAVLGAAIQAGHCLIARRGDAVAGYAVFDQSFYGQGFIALLLVDPAHRRRGIATALIRHIEATCPTAKLFTSTNESNIPMQRLCARLGFRRSGYIDNLDEGDPEIVYFKRLTH